MERPLVFARFFSHPFHRDNMKKKEKEQRGKNEISFISSSFFFLTLFMFSSKSENVNIKLSDKIFTSAKHLFPNRLAYTLKKPYYLQHAARALALGLHRF